MTVALHAIKKRPKFKDSVKVILREHLADCGDDQPVDLYNMVLMEVEFALLEAMMKYTNNHQIRAVNMLGISRTALRRKLGFYKLR
jgi:DNA-binding protein Fis